jgi:hypothetical protein
MSNQLTNGQYSLTLDSLGSLYLPDGVGVLRGLSGASVFMRDDGGPVGIGSAVGYNVVVDTSFGVALTADGRTLQLAPNGDVNFPSGMVVSLLGGISSNATVIGLFFILFLHRSFFSAVMFSPLLCRRTT